MVTACRRCVFASAHTPLQRRVFRQARHITTYSRRRVTSSPLLKHRRPWMDKHVYALSIDKDDDDHESHVLLADTPNATQPPKDNNKSTEEVGFWSWSGQASIDLRFFRRLWRLLSIVKAYPALILPIVSILDAYFVSRAGELTGKFYAVFIENNRAGFRALIFHSLLIFLGTTTVATVMSFLADFFGYQWRKRLTAHVVDRYARDQNYYWLHDMDNPDQRLASDLNHWSLSLAQILKDLASVPYNVIYYTFKVYHHLQSKAVLFTVYAWFIGWALIVKLIIAPSANLLFAQEVREGNFRSALMRLKRYRTEIAASRADEIERAGLERPFRSVLFYQFRVVIWNAIILFITKAQDYLGSLLNLVCIGVVLFSGGLKTSTSGSLAQQISNVSFYLLMLVYSFSRIPDAAQKLTELAGLTPRISQLIEQLDELSHEATEENNNGEREFTASVRHVDEGDVAFACSNLSCWTPGGKIIVYGLTMSLKKGESLLITGPSGVGKSTLLLLLLELYQRYEGDIQILATDEIMMLPQQSVIAPGKSLAAQLTYPQHDQSLTNSSAMEVLRDVGLYEAAQLWCNGDLKEERKWSHVFSAGELQRITLARALLRKPQLLLLDEATSAIPTDLECQIYEKLKATEMTIVTIGHGHTLDAYHDWVLALHGDAIGQWTLTRTTSPAIA